MRLAICTLALALAAGPALAGSKKPCLDIRQEATLEGELRLREEDGPSPGERLTVRVVRTDKAFAICEDDGTAGMWLGEVQLVGADAVPVGSRVRLSGALFWPETDFHVAGMVMTVKAVQIIAAP